MDSFLPDRVLRRNRALRELMGFCRSAIADGEISDEEIRQFEEWVDAHPDMLGVAPLNRIAPILRTIFDDGEVSEEERAALTELIAELSGEDNPLGEAWGRLHRSDDK